MVYKNIETGLIYWGGTITYKVDDYTAFMGEPTVEQLTEWGFEEYEPTEEEINKHKQLPAEEALSIITGKE